MRYLLLLVLAFAGLACDSDSHKEPVADLVLSVTRSGGDWMVVTLDVEGTVTKDTTSQTTWQRTVSAREFDFVTLRGEARGATAGWVQVSIASSKSGLETTSGTYGSVFGAWGSGFTSFAGTTPVVSTGSSCCRVCQAGKPCGDSCISRDRSCNVSSGCAC